MFVELTDILRCARDHEDSWLVLAATRTVDRHVVEGTLGCPVCGAEYPVRGGMADMRYGHDAAEGGEPSLGIPPGAHDERQELALRLAAYSGLAEPGGTVVVGGALSAVSSELEQLTSVRVLSVNPPAPPPPGRSALACTGRLPLAKSSIRALVLDSGAAASLDLDAAVTAVRSGGRVVLPATIPLPQGLTELASDDEWRVAERAAPTITLKRA